MTKAIPLIKKVKTANGHYVYDIFKNEILPVEKIAFEIFDDFFQFSKTQLISKYKNQYEVADIQQEWHYLREKAGQSYFSTQRPEFDNEAAMMANKEAKEQYFRDIFLIPCGDCNLRCAYCTYSGSYEYNRKHINKKMTVDTAAKAIKRLKIPEEDKFTIYHQIHFFGGEPLLNMDVLKFCQQEIDRLAQKGQKIKLIVETNGTLLGPEVANYLVKNKFFLSISIDGPKELHDRYRVQKNGAGSFDLLAKNLKYIKNKYPQYYTNISFTSVLSPPFYVILKRHLEEIFDLIRDNRITFSRVNPFNTTFFTQNELDKNDKYMDDLRETFISGMVNGTDDGDFFLKSYFLDSIKRSMGFMVKDESGKGLKKSVCFIGGQKALVDTDGSLTPCIEYWSKGISMGDVDAGFKVDRINHYTKEFFEQVIPHCKDCWLIRHCQLCPPMFLENNTITQKKRELLCQATQEKYLKDLQMTLSIIEKKPESLKYTEDYRTLKDIFPKN